MKHNNQVYVPRRKQSRTMDAVEKILLVSIMTAFTTAIIIGSAMMIVLITQ
jgi:hypothetical protein